MFIRPYHPPLYRIEEDLLVSLDLETTGLDPNFHLPVQIGAVSGNRQFMSLIGWPMADLATRSNPEAMDIHKLDPRELRKAPRVGEVDRMFGQWLGEVLQEAGAKRARLVGWNVGSFDLCFLRSHFRGSTCEMMSHRCVDLNALVTIDELRGGMPAKRKKQWLQDQAAATLGGPAKWHDALWDARAAMASLYALVEE
jgi:DNA polymerase III epsilon subunit-like protein